MKLIVNADDFGLTSGVTYGIYDAMCRGVVTSTTMMVNTSATLLAAQLAKREPALAVGLHVNISLGGPLTSCPSLLKNGMFRKPAVLGSDEGYDVGELDEELEAQYQCFVTLVGRGPTHIDSHLYAHQKFSNVPFPVSWTVKMKKKQKETQDILSYHTQAAGCSDKARAKASGGRQPIEECGRTGL